VEQGSMKYENGNSTVRAEPFGKLRTGTVEARMAGNGSQFDPPEVDSVRKEHYLFL